MVGCGVGWGCQRGSPRELVARVAAPRVTRPLAVAALSAMFLQVDVPAESLHAQVSTATVDLAADVVLGAF